MNKLILLSCLLITLYSFFSSCSIQRRTFNKGFHIEWRKGLSALPSKEKQEPILCLTDSSSHATILKAISCDSIVSNEHSISENHLGQLHSDTCIATKSTSINAISSSHEFKKALEKETVSDDDPDEEYVHKPTGKVNVIAIISFSLGILAILLFCAGAMIGPEIVLAAIVPAIGAFITGIASRVLQRKNPNLRLSGFGVAGMIIGIITTSLAGLIGLLLMI